MCGIRHNADLAVKIMHRYGLDYSEANHLYLEGKAEWQAKFSQEYQTGWDIIGIVRAEAE